MNVAIITDQHLGARNDSAHMRESMRKFYEQVFFPTLDAYNVRRVLNGGDYVDRRKYVNYSTANFIWNVYREPLRMRNLREDIIVGNHDLYYRDSTTLNSISQLHRDDPTVHVYTEPAELDVDGLGVLMLPWMTENTREATEQAIAKTSCSIVLGHLEIKGFQMYRGMPSTSGLSPEMFDRFDKVMSGHFHHKSQNGVINYLGSPYPTMWSDYRDPRGFHIFDTATKSLTFIENPFSLFVRIIYDDANQPHRYVRDLVQSILSPESNCKDAYVKVVVKTRTQPFWYDMVLDTLAKVTQDIIVIDDVVVNDNGEEEITTVDIDTPQLMRDYVNSLDIRCDKNQLYTYLEDKYRQAQAVSTSLRGL
jgi:DNA repair exonuclease SbcCD nuclease subunit